MDPAFHGIFGYSDWLRWAYLLDGWRNRQCCPLIGWKIVAALDRTPSGDRRESGRSPPGHRRDIGQKFGHLRMKSADGRTVSRRWSSGDHWVSLRLCSRSRKSAGDLLISQNRHPAKIQQNSSGHRTIYVQLGPRLKPEIEQSVDQSTSSFEHYSRSLDQEKRILCGIHVVRQWPLQNSMYNVLCFILCLFAYIFSFVCFICLFSGKFT